MNDKNKIYLIPESFQEYQKLPEKIKEIITNPRDFYR
jgi:hypothetical protein